MTTTVVNIRNAEDDNYIYIGRTNSAYHFGNPFSHLNLEHCVTVPSIEISITEFRLWLRGKRPHIEPRRRRWVLTNMRFMRNHTLGCFCKPNACHGDVYATFMNKRYYVAIGPKGKIYGPSKSYNKMKRKGVVRLLSTWELV
jgi:hypothetical protein